MLAVPSGFSEGIVPDFDYKLTPWKTRADEWRGSPRQTPSVTDWTAYDRLAVDVVNFGVGGEAMCLGQVLFGHGSD